MHHPFPLENERPLTIAPGFAHEPSGSAEAAGRMPGEDPAFLDDEDDFLNSMYLDLGGGD